MKNQIITTAATAALIFSLIPNLAEAKSVTGFTDVSSHDWFSSAVTYVSHKQIMNGHDHLFEPNKNLSREQAATVLWRQAGSPKSSRNVSHYCDSASIDSYARSGVSWAADHGIMNGVGRAGDPGTPFRPHDPLTREQTAKVIALAFSQNINHVSPTRFNSLAHHSDTSSWARQYMIWATYAGVIHGWPDSRGLDPQGATSRAQMAQILMNLLSSSGQGNNDKNDWVQIRFIYNNEEIRSERIKKGSQLNALPTLNLDSNHRLLGWYEGNTRVNEKTIASQNLTLIAHTQHKKTITIQKDVPVYKDVPTYKWVNDYETKMVGSDAQIRGELDSSYPNKDNPQGIGTPFDPSNSDHGKPVVAEMINGWPTLYGDFYPDTTKVLEHYSNFYHLKNLGCLAPAYDENGEQDGCHTGWLYTQDGENYVVDPDQISGGGENIYFNPAQVKVGAHREQIGTHKEQVGTTKQITTKVIWEDDPIS